jgi:hypothetical protein
MPTKAFVKACRGAYDESYLRMAIVTLGDLETAIPSATKIHRRSTT